MGLINKVDMVGLSPVGYGVYHISNTISHRRQTYHINLVDQTHIVIIWLTDFAML